MIWSLAAGFKRSNFGHRAAPMSKVARRAQLCASHWVQGSPLPPAAQAIILSYRLRSTAPHNRCELALPVFEYLREAARDEQVIRNLAERPQRQRILDPISHFRCAAADILEHVA